MVAVDTTAPVLLLLITPVELTVTIVVVTAFVVIMFVPPAIFNIPEMSPLCDAAPVIVKFRVAPNVKVDPEDIVRFVVDAAPLIVNKSDDADCRVTEVFEETIKLWIVVAVTPDIEIGIPLLKVMSSAVAGIPTGDQFVVVDHKPPVAGPVHVFVAPNIFTELKSAVASTKKDMPKRVDIPMLIEK